MWGHTYEPCQPCTLTAVSGTQTFGATMTAKRGNLWVAISTLCTCPQLLDEQLTRSMCEIHNTQQEAEAEGSHALPLQVITCNHPWLACRHTLCGTLSEHCNYTCLSTLLSQHYNNQEKRKRDQNVKIWLYYLIGWRAEAQISLQVETKKVEARKKVSDQI